ncbi:M20/M25/M40 family metallo-hydrolase [uncultured Clostridium sp.]|uniref:M20/M25/M40 family metallo-hydrolase n=1 Tax=uncultured Clostridium sp. TaxID=59620 RepID=UPI0025FBE483|nr:M20/M25/M40 family metallo-hydrolase [uncultured Clostridium sp.]
MEVVMENMMQEIFDYVDQHFGEMVEELGELCSYRSAAGDEQGLSQTREWILNKLGRLNIPHKCHPVEGGNAVISAGMAGTSRKIREIPQMGSSPEINTAENHLPTLLFYNHYDVVQEGKKELWSSSPFIPEIRDEVMYARGVSDNKGPLLSRIQAIQAVLAVTGELPVNVKFFFEGDEETSSPSLGKFTARHPELFKELTKADACLWENGRKDSKGRPWARFGVRGSISFDLSVETSAKDVHARMGTVIPSASWRLVWALASLKNEDERIAIDGFYDDVLPVTGDDEKILESFPYDEEDLKNKMKLGSFLRDATGLQLKKQIYMEPSVSICGLEAGEMYNGIRGIVPHKASARVSFYLVANQDPKKVERQFREHLDRRGFSDIMISARGVNTPVRTPVDIPFKDQLIRAAAKVYREPMVIEPTQLGGGPAIYFHRAWPQMPIVGAGPGNTDGNHHAPDENMRLLDYKESVKHMIALLYEMGGGVAR